MRISSFSDASAAYDRTQQIANSTIANDAIVISDGSEEVTNEKAGETTKDVLKNVVDKINNFMEVKNYNTKFVFHEGLGRYYVKLVDSITDEVVKEIPSKELLDTYYAMQKYLGHLIDESI